MPKTRVNPYALKYPKTPNPMKEMSWCISTHTYVSCNIEGIRNGSQWEMGDKYCITIRQGNSYRESEYIYTKENVVDAIYDTYRYLYNKNYGKKREESGD